MPKQNEKNVLEDLTPLQRVDLTVHYVTTIDEVLKLVLPAGTRKAETPRYDEPRPRFGLA